jgi:hypothetical protein
MHFLTVRPLCLAILWLAWLSGFVRAAEVVGDVKVEPAGSGSVIVKWRTDVESGGRVSYGTTADALTQRAEGGITADHVVTVTGLAPGQKYFYAVGTARKKLATGSFTFSGSPATSPKTAPDASPTKVTSPPRTSPATKLPPASNQHAPPTRATWGNMPALADHFARHGQDFQARDADDYARQAWSFRQRAMTTSLPMKLDEDGTLRIYDPNTGAFAAYNRDGTTKTYFKPGSRDYFARQPGRPVKPGDIPRR